MLMGEMLSAIPRTPAGARARWVLERLAALCAGEGPPNDAEFEQQYTSSWLAEVPMAWVFDEIAPLMASVITVREEAARPNAITIVLDLSDGHALRLRLTVEDAAPHRIKFQLLSPALDSSSYLDRTVQRDGRSVHIRDYGGSGPLLLLWHGAGCDATIWEAVVPSLRGFRVWHRTFRDTAARRCGSSQSLTHSPIREPCSPTSGKLRRHWSDIRQADGSLCISRHCLRATRLCVSTARQTLTGRPWGSTGSIPVGCPTRPMCAEISLRSIARRS